MMQMTAASHMGSCTCALPPEPVHAPTHVPPNISTYQCPPGAGSKEACLDHMQPSMQHRQPCMHAAARPRPCPDTCAHQV